MTKYRKYIVAAVGAAVVIIGRAYGLTSWEYLDAVTVATSFGVLVVPNAA